MEDNIDLNIIDKLTEKSNIITSIFNINDAAELLKNDEPELSFLLLNLVTTLIEQHHLLSSDLDSAKNIVNEIKSANN